LLNFIHFLAMLRGRDNGDHYSFGAAEPAAPKCGVKPARC
jgi:hypothetical protein